MGPIVRTCVSRRRGFNFDLIILNSWSRIRVMLPSSHLERVMTSLEVQCDIISGTPGRNCTDNILQHLEALFIHSPKNCSNIDENHLEPPGGIEPRTIHPTLRYRLEGGCRGRGYNHYLKVYQEHWPKVINSEWLQLIHFKIIPGGQDSSKLRLLLPPRIQN